MHHAVQPFSFLAGREVLDADSAGWHLDQLPVDEGDRSIRTRVMFSTPFANPPLVQLGLTGFDISNQDAARLTASVANVTPEGFDIVIGTWLNTRLWKVELGWLALGA